MSDAAAKLTPIRPGADPNVVRALEEWLEDAKRGELVGVVLLGVRNHSGANQHGWAGDMNLSDALLVFEQFKLRQLLERT